MAGDPVITVRGLVNRFGAQLVHDGLDLDVLPGEILGIVGGSGSGKSVLMRSIIGLQQPAAGRIEVLGQEVTGGEATQDRELTRRFYNEVLLRPGPAPYFCEDWVNRSILAQHFHSPAMWAIFQLQDLLGMDAALRRENPNDERINVPANPKHYWRYRSHLNMEALMKEKAFNAALRALVEESGRG